MHETFYTKNNKYSEFLESHDEHSYKKYVDYIKKYLTKSKEFLDIGCGTGTALKLLNSKNKNTFGVEISRSSVEVCKKKGLDCSYYNGKRIPFKDGSFDIVGSFNVIEHTDNPVAFLDENLRVVKKNGLLFVICPNFFSVTNGYHYHTQGLYKIKNIFSLISRVFINKKVQFEKMKTIERAVYQADDDAVNATNAADIMHWAENNNLELLYWSSQQNTDSPLKNKLDTSTLFRYILGACFFIYRKKE